MNIPDNLSIVKSEYLSDYIIRLSFSDGTINEVDFGNYLYRHPHPQYDKYRDLFKFKKYRIENGDIYWGKHGDLIFPIDNLYFNDLENFYEY